MINYGNYFMAAITGLSGASIFSSCSHHSNNVGEQKHPNIIFILADDLGYGGLGSFGQKLIHPSCLDSMAAQGIRFTRHYAGTSVSAPSRCSLMTGKHCGHCYIRGNKEADPYGQLQLPDSTLTVADILKQAGYTTAMIGKWGLGVQNTPGDPARHSFDLFYEI